MRKMLLFQPDVSPSLIAETAYLLKSAAKLRLFYNNKHKFLKIIAF